MIELFSGTPGSGKSLHAAHEIREALNKIRGADRPVVANFDINRDIVKRPQAFHYYENSDLTPDLLTELADDFWLHTDRPFSEDYLLLVLDECSIIFNARRWMDKGRAGRNDSRMDWLEFLSQHRKYGYKIILISQSAKMIDNQFRMLTEYEINHRKVAHMGLIGSTASLAFGGNLFMQVKYLFQTNERLGLRFAMAHKADMALYDTYARLRQQR